MIKTGLFFGSFNPIHIGHMALSNYMLEFTDLEEVWFVVSPHNPFKKKENLLNQVDRLEMVDMAIRQHPGYQSSNVEFSMPKPSYTIDTLAYLSDTNKDRKFVILMGADGIKHFDHWKNAEKIIELYPRYIYPRPNSPLNDKSRLRNTLIAAAPLIEISSSFIRKSIKAGKNITFFLPNGIYEHIKKKHFYE